MGSEHVEGPFDAPDDDRADPHDWDIPIVDDLVELYNEVIRGEAAICHFQDYGPRNSRWLNLQASKPHNLRRLIVRVSQLSARVEALEELIRRRSH